MSNEFDLEGRLLSAAAAEQARYSSPEFVERVERQLVALRPHRQRKLQRLLPLAACITAAPIAWPLLAKAIERDMGGTSLYERILDEVSLLSNHFADAWRTASNSLFTLASDSQRLVSAEPGGAELWSATLPLTAILLVAMVVFWSSATDQP